jgi:hypothetical protein
MENVCQYRKAEYGSKYEGEEITDDVPFFEKRNRKEEEYTEVCMRVERRGIMWRKVGVWRLKGFRSGMEERMFLVFRKEEGLFQILECKGMERKD